MADKIDTPEKDDEDEKAKKRRRRRRRRLNLLLQGYALAMEQEPPA